MWSAPSREDFSTVDSFCSGIVHGAKCIAALNGFRYIVGKSRHRAHTESQREESGESQFQGSLWRATLSREAWMPIWGLSTESMKPWPPPGGGRGYGTKRRRWCGGTGVPGGHDTHRPFTNRKAAPGEGTVIRARVGRPIPFRARSAQGPVHFPPTWRVMMRRCHPGQPGQGRRARAESGGLGGGKGGRRARVFFLFRWPKPRWPKPRWPKPQWPKP